MENDARYFWRRAVDEMAAARRSVTPAARKRHENFARLYLDRLAQLGAPFPFAHADIGRYAPVAEAETAAA